LVEYYLIVGLLRPYRAWVPVADVVLDIAHFQC